MAEELRVEVDRPYPVLIGRGALDDLARVVPSDVTRVAVIFTPSVSALATTLVSHFHALAIEVPDAELAKTGAVLESCWDQLGAAGFTRNDLIITVGGGATTDLGGFVAATWLRGIRVIHVPTSLLAMVDAAVGGKTGINIAAGKNLVGAFHHPTAVVCDLALLDSLPARELTQGMAEVVKCGFISDERILEIVRLAAPIERDSVHLPELVARAIAVKADVVADDFTESKPGGLGREILNYGHTLGHAIERREQFQMRHGEAISIGMAYVALLANRLGRLNDTTLADHLTLLDRLNLPTSYDAGAWPELREFLNLDKKNRGATLRFIGLEAFGQPFVIEAPPEELLAEVYAELTAKGDR